jgi:hypothetical protein
MPEQPGVIGRLVAGDIFHATCSNGASLICLIEDATEKTIRARTVTHQIKVEFDRGTGLEIGAESDTPCKIDSIAPLPIDLHNVILGLDRKMRLEPDLLKHKLTEEERKALIFVASHYPLNPL